MVLGVSYLFKRLGQSFFTWVYIIIAFASTCSTLGIFGYILRHNQKHQEFNDTAFPFDVAKNAAAGLGFTAAAIVLTMFDFYLLNNPQNFSVTPITIACGSLAVFIGIAFYLALPNNTLVMWLVLSQAAAVGVQFGAIANVNRKYKHKGNQRQDIDIELETITASLL